MRSFENEITVVLLYVSGKKAPFKAQTLVQLALDPRPPWTQGVPKADGDLGIDVWWLLHEGNKKVTKLWLGSEHAEYKDDQIDYSEMNDRMKR